MLSKREIECDLEAVMGQWGSKIGLLLGKLGALCQGGDVPGPGSKGEVLKAMELYEVLRIKGIYILDNYLLTSSPFPHHHIQECLFTWEIGVRKRGGYLKNSKLTEFGEVWSFQLSPKQLEINPVAYRENLQLLRDKVISGGLRLDPHSLVWNSSNYRTGSVKVMV